MYVCMYVYMQVLLSLTYLNTPEGGGEELVLEFLGVYQDESKVLLCGAVLGLDVL